MKKHILCTGLFLFLLFFCNTLLSQEVIMPDNQMQSALQDLKWKENATTFCTYNGDLYMIVWDSKSYMFTQSYYPYVYKYTNGEFQPFLVNNTNQLKFGYKNEDDYPYKDGIYNFIVESKPLFFSYYGKMWYYSLNLVWEGLYKKYYELWARYDEGSGWTTWYTKYDDLPGQLNMGVCQVDSTLRFIAHETSTNKFYAKDYQYNAATNKPEYNQTVSLPIITADRLDGVLVYKDEFNNNCFIYNTYTAASNELMITVDSPLTGAHHLNLFGLNVIGMENLKGGAPAGVSSLLMGSVQGKKTTESYDPAKSTRFNCFYVGAQKSSTNCFPLYNYEFIIQDNPNKDPLKYPYLFRYSSVVLPASAYPDLVSGQYCLQGATLMTPKAFGSDTAVKNGLQQQLMLFYPDSKKKFNGSIFNSDFWQPVPGSSVSSLDLANDSIYGPQIRKLWTLVGIVDGAPPCSINWPVWEDHHSAINEPTELAFTVDNVSTSEVTSSYEDKYSLGGSIETGFGDMFSLETSFKYAHTYKSKVSSKNTVKSVLTTNFGLNEHSQELGYYIWNIPLITRNSYQVYPWYDTKLAYPVSNTLQYQFRTVGVLPVTENKEIGSFPWLINHPNDPSLNEWKAGSRVAMYNDISGYGLSPLQAIGWTSPNPGQHYSFSETNTTTSSVESTCSYSWGINTSVAIPEVFKISGSYDQDISYSTENKYETEFGNEVEVSLTNLNDKVFGVNISYYDMSIFWFKPNVADWWYLDSVNGQKPWYIAYIVGTTHAKIKQIAPGPGTELKNNELLFSWKTEDGEVFDDYTIVVSTESQSGPGSTVYSASCGKMTYAGIRNLNADPGKTYYWAVKGKTADGEIVWSEFRAFKVKDDESASSPATLKAGIYPNPGKCSDININIDNSEKAPVEIMLLDSKGLTLAKSTIIDPGNIPFSSVFPYLDLSPGIYFAVIRNREEKIVKKILIN